MSVRCFKCLDAVAEGGCISVVVWGGAVGVLDWEWICTRRVRVLVCTGEGELGYEARYVCVGIAVWLVCGIGVCRYVGVAVWFGGVHVCVWTHASRGVCVEMYVTVCGVCVDIGVRCAVCGRVCWCLDACVGKDACVGMCVSVCVCLCWYGC